MQPTSPTPGDVIATGATLLLSVTCLFHYRAFVLTVHLVTSRSNVHITTVI